MTTTTGSAAYRRERPNTQLKVTLVATLFGLAALTTTTLVHISAGNSDLAALAPQVTSTHQLVTETVRGPGRPY